MVLFGSYALSDHNLLHTLDRNLPLLDHNLIHFHHKLQHSDHNLQHLYHNLQHLDHNFHICWDHMNHNHYTNNFLKILLKRINYK